MKLTVGVLGSVCSGVAVAHSGANVHGAKNFAHVQRAKNFVVGLDLDNPELSEASLVNLEDLLVDKYEKAGDKLEGRSTGVFDDLSAMINQTMTPAILTAHDSAQEQLHAFIEAFNLCAAPEAAQETGDGKAPIYPAVEAKLVEHRECRAKQAAAKQLQDKCNEDLGRERTVANAACNSVPGSDGQPPALDTATHVGCKVTPNDYEGWLASFGHQVDLLKDQYDTAQFGCGNATKLADEMEPKCLAANQTTAGNKSLCDGIQLTADTMGCSSEVAVAHACTIYGGCYEAAKQAYLAQNESIAAAQLNRTAQWRVLKRMQCLLKEEDAGASHAGIDACKEATIDTSHLDLVYPPVPAKTDCGDLSVEHKGAKPCSSEWVEQYGALASPAGPCTPCATTTTTTWQLVFRQTFPFKWPQKQLNYDLEAGSHNGWTGDNWAILANLESFRSNGKFEFKLVWTSSQNLPPQQWKQTSNPATQTSNPDGYEKMKETTNFGSNWNGLWKGNWNSKNCVLACSKGGDCWYGVGVTNFKSGGYGGPDGNIIKDGKVELYVVKREFSAGSKSWPLVFRQSYPFTFKPGQYELNPKGPASNNFAILNQLEKYRTTGGKFEFKMVWPGLQEQMWRQSSNPVNGAVTGYEAVSVPYTCQNWIGLEKSDPRSGALLDGSRGTSWWYAIGTIKENWAGGFYPGPCANKVYGVELYVKAPLADSICESPLRYC